VDERHDNRRATALRQPVDLERVDAHFLRRHAEAHASIAAEIINSRASRFKREGRVSVEKFADLCTGAASMVHNRSCRRGLRLNGLCSISGVGEGHVREHFTPMFTDACALAVRAAQMVLHDPILYDTVYAQMTDTREAQSLGSMDGGVRHLMVAPTSEHTSCPDRMCVLVTGTRHDRASSDANLLEIAAFEKALGTEIPSSVPEHLKPMLIADANLRKLVYGSGEAFSSLGLSRHCDPPDAFPSTLVVPVLSLGPALEDRDLGQIYVPGLDEEMLGLARLLDRGMMLSMGEFTFDEAQLERRYGRYISVPTPEDYAKQVVTPAAKQARRFGFGPSSPPFGVEYRSNGEVLVRCQRNQDRQGRVGVTCEAWRLVNVQRSEAVMIAEHRAREIWQQDCLANFFMRTEPGLLQAPSPRVRTGMHALECYGNAANVTAERRVRRRSQE
jgi:hypothetical protein